MKINFLTGNIDTKRIKLFSQEEIVEGQDIPNDIITVNEIYDTKDENDNLIKAYRNIF
jgi:hypothetical protein